MWASREGFGIKCRKVFTIYPKSPKTRWKNATLSKVQVGIRPKQDSNSFFSKHAKYFP